MAQRDGVEGLQQRHAALEAEVGTLQRERDEAARLLAEATRAGLPVGQRVDGGDARRARRAWVVAALGAAGLALGAVMALGGDEPVPDRGVGKAVLPALPGPLAGAIARWVCAGERGTRRGDDAVAAWTAEVNPFIGGMFGGGRLTCDAARSHPGRLRDVYFLIDWRNAQQGQRMLLIAPAAPRAAGGPWRAANQLFGFGAERGHVDGTPVGNGIIEVDDAPDLRFAGAMTVEAWVNQYRGMRWSAPHGGSSPPIVSKWEADGAERGYELVFERHDLAFRVSEDGTEARVGRVAAPWSSLHDWAHVAATYDGQSLRLFINGELRATAPWSRGIHAGRAQLTIGSTLRTHSYFVGEIDDVALYARALSPAEIAGHARGGTPYAR